MHRKTRLELTGLNTLLTCSLCKGYLIDATTLTECLHSFCRSCLVRYLHTSHHCPDCDAMVHKSRPLLNVRPDRALQSLVYKLVPGLFKDEMKKRRDFYSEHPVAGTSAISSTPSELEARGEVRDRAYVIYSDDEHMDLSLEYFIPYSRNRSSEDMDIGVTDSVTTKRTHDVIEDEDYEDEEMIHKRYLRCPAAVCIKHIKKFIKNKFDVKPKYQIEITHVDNEEDPLPDDYTLMDVAYIYAWRRIGPLPLVFRVFQETIKRQKTTHVPDHITIPEDSPAKAVETVERNPITQERTDVAPPVTITIDDIDDKCEESKEKSDGRTDESDNNSGGITERSVEKSGGKPEVVDLTEGGSLTVSPETNLTHRQLLPKLRLPMINIFQTTGEINRNGEFSFNKAMVESLATRAMEMDNRANNKPVAKPGKAVNEKRLLLDEMVREKIKMSLLSASDESNNNGKRMNGIKSNGMKEKAANDLPMQLNSNAVSLDASTTPVVPVR